MVAQLKRKIIHIILPSLLTFQMAILSNVPFSNRAFLKFKGKKNNVQQKLERKCNL